jgi:AcrR family transcriptional regulator
MSSAVQRTRRREQRENTRREILAAADRFLRERPYRELSVDAVMEQTGLTRTAFYRHFDDVTQLVLRLLEDIGAELYAAAEKWLEGAVEDFGGAAHDGLRGIVEFFERHGRLIRAISEAGVLDEEIERVYRGFLEFFIEMTKRGFDELVAAGRMEAVDTGQLARAMSALNEHYLVDQFGREPVGDPEVVLATLETVWNRVVTRR